MNLMVNLDFETPWGTGTLGRSLIKLYLDSIHVSDSK